MADYDLIERLTTTFRALEQALRLFREQLNSYRLLAGRVFQLPDVHKGCEHEPLERIDVNQRIGKEAHEATVQHFTHLFIQQQSEKISSKAAVRLPGAVCYAVNHGQYQQTVELIERINRLKLALEKIISVDSGLTSMQRFEWVHRHIPGLITLNAYRTITLVDKPTTLRFGWANKQIIKNLSHHEVIVMLENSLKANRAVPPFTREQWAAQIERELNNVTMLPPAVKLKIKRPVKVQPVARVWYQERQKQVQYACPSPLVVLCQQDNAEVPPEMGELLNYDAEKICHRYKPEAQPLQLLIPRLHLYYQE